MTPIVRRYQGDADAWRIRAFLRETFLANERHEHGWHVARFDYANWHVCRNVADVQLEDIVWLWEADGRLVGLAMPDGGPGEAHLSLAPHVRSPDLEASVLEVAETELAASTPEGARRLVVWAQADDTLRGDLLGARGYRRSGVAERQWRRHLTSPVSVAAPAPGYCVRALGDGLELLERCYASGLAFHDGDERVALDNRADPSWYRNIQRAPLYRRDLDLVAVAHDGAVAGFVTAWFDDATRSAVLEPVGVVPTHQRRGLGRALLTEALARAQQLGATLALVGGYDERANALYGSVMTDGADVSEAWLRTW